MHLMKIVPFGRCPIVYLMIIFFSVGLLNAQTKLSFFGVSGLSFIPTASISQPGSFAASYSSNPTGRDDVTLYPSSLRMGYTLKSRPLEISFTNTLFYANQTQGVDIQNVIFPMIPSFKYQVVSDDTSGSKSQVAFGLAMPYGAFYVYDRAFGVAGIPIKVHTGVGTKLTTYHAFFGVTLTLGAGQLQDNQPAPFRVSVEGSWGGSLQDLKAMEESFIAATSIYQWTRNITLEVFLRLDAGYNNSDPTRYMGIGLGYNSSI